MISRGAEIKGHVSEVSRGFHGRILLSFDEIKTPHGWMPLAATVTDVPGEHGVKTDDREGEIERKGVSKQRVIEAAAIGAGTGLPQALPPEAVMARESAPVPELLSEPPQESSPTATYASTKASNSNSASIALSKSHSAEA